MGFKYSHEAIRNVRSRKGVMRGLDVTSAAAGAELAVTAGRAKFGMKTADIVNEQTLNEGGPEQEVAAPANLVVSALADGYYTLFLKTDGTLATTPEAETVLSDGPAFNVNHPDASVSPNAMSLGTPSIQLCQFKMASSAVVAGSITYAQREEA